MQRSRLIKISIVLSTALFISNFSAANIIAKKKPALNKKSITLRIGQKTKLKVKNTRKTVSWKSSKKKVASVNSNGRVSARKSGTAYITARISSRKLKCRVTVKKRIISSSTSNSASTDTNSTNLPQSNTYDTPKPTATINPNSLLNSSTDSQNKRDDGWMPGWY